ncbi:uncharacterized protein LOC119984139 isoform X2 [Tripterygium wilfordii]|uniref:uncharacterized protein LOC119984139 isoform X2 n=1 Tax=Tripterygium wilfordii TaxID=458696 RepID=UPI0018F86042|nr:uncharacterized protein LOC119984139 isoform X2 [Tripterygium wilfordii]
MIRLALAVKNAVLVQSTSVQAIKWTGSGDGVIAGGIEVVLWKRRNKSWEIAWKFKRDQPQNLVSATWSIEGPCATAGCPSISHEGHCGSNSNESVLVCYSDGKPEYATAELHHPQPVSMIQWRPSMRIHSEKDVKNFARHVLLTCCLDGSVRLWTEMDSGKAREPSRDYADHEIVQRSFCVAATIEINHALNCTLGTDVFLNWATEIGGIFKNTDGANKVFPASGYEHDKMDRCEWLIGFGPKMLVTFWAIHYLDDLSPVRFPQVTLWKRLDLQDLNMGHIHRTEFSDFKRKLLLSKVVISRNYLSGPPNMCSLIHLLPCNSLYWSQLYTQPSNDTRDTSVSDSGTSNFSLCSQGGLLNIGGHTGKILQVSLHPNICEVELAVSLDSSGLVLFWSLSTIPNCTMGQITLVPRWKLCGNLSTQDSCLPYTSLRWAPSISGEDRVLLMGHIGGIDCFVVKISRSEEDVLCHYICTIPFTGHGPYEDGPTNIFTIPLPSTCNKTFRFNKFMLLSVWEKGFNALSWELMLHSYDTVTNCSECSNFSKNISGECRISEFESTFGGKRYCLGILCCSSQLPEPHIQDHITSFAVLSPGNLTCIKTNTDFMKDLISNEPAYVMATGCFDGSLKLWRSNSTGSSTLHVPWELVGKFVAHQGPVSAICLTDCGRKIATICTEGSPDRVSSLRIWDSVHLTLAGSFRLEDTLPVSKGVVALNWLSLGNGQLFLGVSSQKKLLVYAQRRSGCQILLNPGNSLKSDTWLCVAVAHTEFTICDFLWGPRATAIVVHENFFSIFSEWMFLIDNKNHATCYAKSIADKPLDYYDGTGMENLSAVFTHCKIDAFGKLSVEDSYADCKSRPLESNTDHLSCSLLIAQHELKLGARTMLGLWSMLEVEQKLRGSLPIYHPGALFMNIFSGNWKRAYVSVRHLVEYLVSNCSSESNCDSAESSCIVPHILLSSYYEGIFSKTSTDDERFRWSRGSNSTTSSLEFDRGFTQFASSSEFYGSRGMLSSHPTKSELSGFVEPIEKLYKAVALKNEEKMQLLAIIDLLGEISNPHSASAYENLDEAGRRFWVALRFQQLYSFRSFEKVVSTEELVVDSALIGWAFHSDCQETLFDAFLPSEPSWQQMRALGVGYWFTNVTQLRTRMEKLARLQYLKRKDPKECALLYIALNRLQVLTGLFKISRDEKDKPLVGFLTRNFQDDKNKAAALKNAYVLMGRHQFQLAIAFFLLAGDTSSAISVCAKNLKDEQLAVVICRLIEGPGGPSEHHFLTKFMIPSAIERGDNWLVSLLEWVLGNYFKSFLSMLGLQESIIDLSAISANHVAFMDPSIGLYCLTLVTKNCMRNAIGERNAVIFGRWANLMIASALNRCGLPLEALESLSTSSSTLGNTDQGSVSDAEAHQTLPETPNISASNSFNWLSCDVALHLESHAKLDLAVQYLSELMREHPSFPDPDVGPAGAKSYSLDYDIYQLVTENFRHKLFTAVAEIERKFSLASSSLLRMILVWLCHKGLSVIGYDLLVEYISEDPSQAKSHRVSFLYPLLRKPLLKATEDISLLFSRFIVACGVSSLQLKPCYTENDVPCGVRNPCIDSSGLCVRGVRLSLQSLRAALMIFSGYMTEDVITKPLVILDLFEYYLEFASAWLHRNPKSLFLVVEPILITFTNGHTPYEVDMVNLRQLLLQIPELGRDLSIDDVRKGLPVLESIPDKKCGDVVHSISEDEKWHVIGVCLWQHMYNFLNHQLQLMSIKFEDGFFASATHGKCSPWASGPSSFESDCASIEEETKFCCLILAKLLKTSLELISYYHVKRLALILHQKVENGLNISILQWLGGSNTKLCHQPINQGTPTVDVRINNDDLQVFDILWDKCADPNLISKGFEQEKINTSHFFSHKSIRSWIDIYKSITEQHGVEKIYDHQLNHSSSPASGEVESSVKGLFRNALSFLNFWQKDTTPSNGLCYFQNPKEICKRNGELLEAICVNSIDQRQAAVASNRKGIIFFNWDDGMPFRDQSDYIWSDTDWPLNGWPGTESTPVPTFASPGIDLGNKKGAHLGLGGATTGGGTLASVGRNLTSSGAVEIPGYVGVSASGLGWQIQEDFKEFLDRPATVENISTRAFSSHPLRPFFLVGSINTHVYLWEFGKDKATATYGVLPAANVPPPYALASISALQFDLCGHRFATAAIDGTVSTWHLEVGGRSNIRPTASSLCFNSHALDVTHVTSSGSVIAATGYSSTGANVAIWDTLAPPTTSCASIICHEGGARSISAFDNDIGSGSVSQLIVTGGKGGDVGLHDLRYIVTGKSRHFDNGGPSQNGMLWYIPKAHLGSVTKVATIPNTSLFLTGSEDRDVKLWDAKAARLVYHWPKMHERHTFLKPSSHGFGGVVRAAVTDIQVVSNGFLTCGGDGSVRLVQLENLNGT